MPVLKHAKKKLRQDKKRTLANKKTKSNFKELVKKARTAPSKDTLSAAFKAIDKAAKANLIHDNKAGRLKSALSKATNTNKPTTKSETTNKVAKKTSTKKTATKSAVKKSTK